jgi:hypothetical protein
MSKLVHIETKDGVSAMTMAVDPKEPPPPAGWERAGGIIMGPEGCLVEDLLVRGLDSGDAVGLFSLATDGPRQDLSHDQDTAGIVDHCRQHGITVEPGEIVDDESGRLVEGALRIFRGWRMTGEGCSWGSADYHFMTREDGKRACSVCGQEVKPR